MTVYIRGTSFDSVILIIFSMLWIVCIHWTPTSKWGMDLWSRLRMPQWMWTCTFRFSSDTVQVGCIIQSINSHFFIKLLPMQAFLPRRVIVHICVCFWMTGRKVIVISSFCFLPTFLKKKKVFWECWVTQGFWGCFVLGINWTKPLKSSCVLGDTENSFQRGGWNK